MNEELKEQLKEVIRLAKMVDDFSELQSAIKRLEALCNEPCEVCGEKL